jgi:tetratricopeptide (TPR) repeat protein
MRLTLAIFAVAALAGGGAQGAVEVLGDGPARMCFLAANGEGFAASGVEVCSKALRTDLTHDDRAATYINRGVVELNARDYDAAVSDFDQGIGVKPQMGEGYLNRGATYIALNRFREALDDIDKGLALGISKPHIGYYDRAIAHEGLGDARAAFDDYTRAHELAPDFTRASDQLKRFKVIEKPDGT